MSDTATSEYRLDFTPEDVQRVDSYRRRKDTSVLTIMFTDIEGFSEITETKGDRAANELRRLHDQMLGEIIEAGGAGQVIKHIGDAVMAVFSEPSAAVDKALAIQQRLREFNREHAELDDLSVRIGLHMGQVTTENQVDLDVFGRHVNRASRVEGLAGGGQIFLTYSVFDSARGWLTEGIQIAWHLHGDYYVKGIPEAIAIYEVYDAEHTAPRPPRGARKKRSHMLWLALACSLAATVGLAVWLVMRSGQEPSKPAAATQPAANDGMARSVTLIKMPDARLYLDHTTRLIMDGQAGQRVRKALTKVPVGEHVLHWTFSTGVRYYAHITVTEGDNVIEPTFRANRLPNLSRHVKFTGPGPHRCEDSRSMKYLSYDVDNQPHEHKADLALSIEMTGDNVDPTKLKFTYNWRILVDGREISTDSLTVTNPADRKEPLRDEKVVFQDDYHYFEIHYYIIQTATELEIRCGYGEAPPK